MKKQFLLALLITVVYHLPSAAQLSFSTRVVKDSLFIPWEIIYGPDNHIWFTQKNGYICRLDPASGHTDTLYHESNTVIEGTGEGGMLGMALHPQLATQPYVYVAYEYLNGTNYTERIVRYTYNGTMLQAPLVLLDFIVGATYHNGCRLLIVGDKLFITTGDATVGSNAQNSQLINGKILRLNLDGTIPADNPIPGNALWSKGHRNPQGLVYANNMLYSSEHGPNNDDEINIIVKGRNYGWPNVEGYCNLAAEQTFCNDSNVVEPIQAWTPTIAPCGIDYYDHPMFPVLQGSLLLNTLKNQHLYQLKLNSSYNQVVSATVIAGVSFGRLRDICISPQGSIFLSTSNSVASGVGAKIDKIIELYNPNFSSIPTVPNSRDIIVYPNPASNTLHFATGSALPAKGWNYAITDMAGKQMLEGKTMSGEEINVMVLPEGIYIIKCWNADGATFVRKFSKKV